MGLKVVYVLKC